MPMNEIMNEWIDKQSNQPMKETNKNQQQYKQWWR